MVPGRRPMSNKKAVTTRAAALLAGGESTRASSDRIALDRWSVPPLNLSGPAPCDHPSARARLTLAMNLAAGEIVCKPTRRLDLHDTEKCARPLTQREKKQGEPHGIWILAVPAWARLGAADCPEQSRRCPPPPAVASAAARDGAKRATFGRWERRRIFLRRGVPRETRSHGVPLPDARAMRLSRQPPASRNPPAIAAAYRGP